MTAEELLMMSDDVETYIADDALVIDPESRTILTPVNGLILGVESDKEAERVQFVCPRFVGDNIDLSELQIRTIYQNANGEKDFRISTDVSVDGDNIRFSWLLSRKVTKYKGKVKFIVCAIRTQADGTTKNEWNTTLAEGISLEGLEVDILEEEFEEPKDIVLQLLGMLDEKATEIMKEIDKYLEKLKIDNNLDVNSENAIQNKVVAKQFNRLSEENAELKGDIINLKPIVTGDTTFIESVYNHVKGLISETQGYWGTNGDEVTLSKMSFVTAPNSNVYGIKPIELKANVPYKTTNARVYLCYIYDKVTKIYTRYYQVTTWKEKVSPMEITPQNDSILYMTVNTPDKNAMVVNGDVPSSYHAYGEPIGNSVTIPNLNITVKHNVITVKKDGSGDFTTVYDAVNSITDVNKYNIYDIHIHEGTYDVIDEVFGSSAYYKTEGIVLQPYINLIGIGQRDNIILKAEFPNTVSTQVSTTFSTINVDGSNDLENITFIAYNCRYACHDDDGNAEKSRNFVRNVKNCRFWHKGCYTDDGSVWKWCKAYAQGLSSGSVSNFEYCEFRTDVNINGNCAWSSHGQKDVEKPSYITHQHCKFINTHFDLCASTNGLNDHTEEYIKYIGCEFTRSVGTGNNVEINKEKFESDGVYFNAYGVGNKNCYAGLGIYASGNEDKLHFFANDN